MYAMTESPESGFICSNCENETFEVDHGRLYCLRCAIAVNGYMETAVENENVYRYVGSRDEELAHPPPSPDTDPINYEETRDRFVEGFVMMIMSQCDALVEKFNVTPLIIGLVGPICLRFLSLSGVFDKDSAQKAIRDADLLEGLLKRATWLCPLRKSVPLSASLAICLLACRKAQANVVPEDIVRWAREAKIPYPCSYLISLEWNKYSFLPCVVVSAQILDDEAASIAHIITGLSLPYDDLYIGTASNYLERLSIVPDEDDKKILLDLVRLIQKWSIDKLGVPKKRVRSSGRVVARKMKRVFVRHRVWTLAKKRL